MPALGRRGGQTREWLKASSFYLLRGHALVYTGVQHWEQGSGGVKRKCQWGGQLERDSQRLEAESREFSLLV